MAEKLKTFPESSGHGRRHKKEWFDGSIWQLEPDEVSRWKDRMTCRSALYQLARRRGWETLKTRSVDTPDGEGLIIQCVGLQREYWLSKAASKKESDQQTYESCELKVHEFNPTRDLTETTIIKDICALFDEVLDGEYIWGNATMARNHQWIPPSGR